MTDKPVLKTPGELLIEARQAVGLELDFLSERTKIPVGILQSLERDEYHKISGPLYVNSFLKTYAEDLGLDPVEVLEMYVKFSGEVVSSGPAIDTGAVWVDEEVQISRIGLPWGLIGIGAGVVVVLVVLIVLLMGLRGCSSGDGNVETDIPSSPVRESLLPESLTASSSADEIIDANESTSDSSEPTEILPETEAALVEEELPAATAATPVEAPVRSLPAAASGSSGLSFQDGTRWPVVLRILCVEPVRVQVVRDGDRTTLEARWRSAGDTYPVLPAAGIQHGLPYQVREGLVIYWGARDQFSVKLDRTNDVEVSLNGRSRDIDNLLPGQEIILFVP